MPEAAQADAPALEGARDRRSEFVPVGPGGETSSAEVLLITAYIVMWALIFGLIFVSQRRQKKLDARLLELEGALAKLDHAAAHSGGAAG